MVTLEEIRAAIASQPSPECLKLTTFELIDASAEAGSAKVQFAPQPAFANHFGHIQGGFAAAMLDVPISAAVFVKLNQWLPTVELKFSFMRPAKIGTRVGEGRVLRAGRAIVFVEGKLWGSDGELAVHPTATVAAMTTETTMLHEALCSDPVDGRLPNRGPRSAATPRRVGSNAPSVAPWYRPLHDASVGYDP